jgi:hypothetical protein
MKKPKITARKAHAYPKFASFSDAYRRADAGDERAQRAFIGCLNNLGCDHLADHHKQIPVLWKRCYHALRSDYIGSLVGEYGIPEHQAERDILAELNCARDYSDDVKLS